MRSIHAGLCILGMGLFLGFMRYMQTGFGENFGVAFSLGGLVIGGLMVVAMSIERRENRAKGLNVDGDPIDHRRGD